MTNTRGLWLGSVCKFIFIEVITLSPPGTTNRCRESFRANSRGFFNQFATPRQAAAVRVLRGEEGAAMILDSFKLDGKMDLVTGAGRGSGKAWQSPWLKFEPM